MLEKGRKLHKQLQLLIDKALGFDLPIADIAFAKDFLEHNEYNLCLDQIATQLYEYHITIDNECYDIIIQLSELMDISSAEYEYLKELLPE